MEDENKMKFECVLDTYHGNLTIDLLDVVRNLSDEQKMELVSDGGFWSFIEDEFARSIVKEFSRDSYNEEYTRLRGLILTSESMPSVVREWAVSLIESREHAKEREQYWNNAYWSLYHWARETFSAGYTRFDSPKLPDNYYGKPYSEELMKDVEKNIAEWTKLFPAPQSEG